MKRYTLLDSLVLQFDNMLRSVSGGAMTQQRANPADSISEAELTIQEKKHVAGLMRVNHSGEVCAQALYHGQALTTNNPLVKQTMQQAATEEGDHLAWCEQRLCELKSHTSYLNPLWYVGSLTIGAVAGLLGDKWSLGFVVETERQVEAHLQNHLYKLPPQDQKSRAIIQQMQYDEIQHAENAIHAGAKELPNVFKSGMHYASKVMTMSAYYI